MTTRYIVYDIPDEVWQKIEAMFAQPDRKPRKKTERQKTPRRPCVVCGKMTTHIYCSARCVAGSTPEQRREADRIGLALLRERTATS
jgi:predicted nucleic acid-binding Zn ribbon protein